MENEGQYLCKSIVLDPITEERSATEHELNKLKHEHQAPMN